MGRDEQGLERQPYPLFEGVPFFSRQLDELRQLVDISCCYRAAIRTSREVAQDLPETFGLVRSICMPANENLPVAFGKQARLGIKRAAYFHEVNRQVAVALLQRRKVFRYEIVVEEYNAELVFALLNRGARLEA